MNNDNAQARVAARETQPCCSLSSLQLTESPSAETKRKDAISASALDPKGVGEVLAATATVEEADCDAACLPIRTGIHRVHGNEALGAACIAQGCRHMASG